MAGHRDCEPKVMFGTLFSTRTLVTTVIFLLLLPGTVFPSSPPFVKDLPRHTPLKLGSFNRWGGGRHTSVPQSSDPQCCSQSRRRRQDHTWNLSKFSCLFFYNCQLCFQYPSKSHNKKYKATIVQIWNVDSIPEQVLSLFQLSATVLRRNPLDKYLIWSA